MENYADYEFYVEEYKGSLSIDLFNFLIIKASRDIDRNINCKLNADVINSLSEEDQYKIKYVACELVDYINNFGGNSSRGKANEIRLDGVAITRNNKSESMTIKNKSQIYDNLPHNLTRWL